VVVARELTKLHEELWRGSLADAARWAETPVRGEVVLVLGGEPGRGETVVDDEVLAAALAGRLSAGERTRGAVDEVASAFGVPRRRVYDLALAARDTVEQGTAPEDPAEPGTAPGDPAEPDAQRSSVRTRRT
jgi:16S rRNA (cytidine1402-2'-O)-methyltransferase